MDFFAIILPSIVAFLVAHFLKGLGQRFSRGLSDLERSYGGRASSHTAFVTALTTAVGIQEGIDSALFAVTLAFSIVIITDAVIFRRNLQHFGVALRRLVSRLPDEEQQDFPPVNVRLGHTPSEAAIGLLIGLLAGGLAAIL